jgi:hypothetical protein
MSALTAKYIGLCIRAVTAFVTRSVKTNTACKGGGFAMLDDNGDVLPLSTAAGFFAGLFQSDVASSASAQNTLLSVAGQFLASITSVDKSYIGRPVFCATDNPADLTVTWSATAKYIGRIMDLEYDSAGAVTGKCWVEFDAALAEASQVKLVEMSFATAPALVSEACGYRCPTGRKATLLGFSYEYDAKPVYATSAALAVQKITGTTRTTALNAATVDINNTAVVADTDTALTNTAVAADLELAAGDRLVSKVTVVGVETARGNVKVHAVLLERPA